MPLGGSRAHRRIRQIFLFDTLVGDGIPSEKERRWVRKKGDWQGDWPR